MNSIRIPKAEAELTLAESGGTTHTLLVADVSWSMGEEGLSAGGGRKIDDAIGAMRQLVETKFERRPNDTVSIVTFCGDAKILCNALDVRRHYNVLLNAMEMLRGSLGNYTRLVHGLEASLAIIGDEPQAQISQIIAYSDGHDHEPEAAKALARVLKSRGVIIETIGFGRQPSDVDVELLRAVATTDASGTHYRFIGSASALKETFKKLATGMLTMD